MLSELLPRQQRFVSEYLTGMSAAEAARQAGYSKNCARQIASEILAKPDVRRHIEQQRFETEQRLQIRRDNVLKGFMEAYQEAKLQGSPGEMIRALTEVAKLMGYYTSCGGPCPTQVPREQGSGQVGSVRVEQLVDQELMRIAQWGQPDD